ncbi:hypothetical protein GCM10009111_04370 [Colwellia asteriadis]|uniref:GGDEF domain-containing protein n=1 Tax=Colwellia asteriadis TaxID=517723 RepID=A0ABN1L347_9GAMM
MKYHDSIETADKIMRLVVAQLKKWQLAINPINYAVVYEYYKKSNAQLTAAIEKELLVNESLNGFFMENLYKETVLEKSEFREEILTDLSTLINDSHHNQQELTSSSIALIHTLEKNITQLSSSEPNNVKNAISSLTTATEDFKAQILHLSKQLECHQEDSQRLSAELTQARHQINLDKVTGLFNKKAISSHISAWQQQYTPCNIAAISIKIEEFNKIERDFGVLFSDVILTKIAHKIASYIHDSGLPVRFNYDEFILLLPQASHQTATEIGTKITQSIRKMRFVSIKSDIKLPQINSQFSVNHMEEGENIDDFLKKTKIESTLAT